MAKRKRQEEILHELESYGLDTLASQLQSEGGRARVAQAALTLAYLGGLTIPDLQAFSDTIPAFSKARWEKIAPQFGLEVDKSMTQLKLFTVSRAFLPPSFHREVMKNSAWWLDVYQEIGSHSREAARVRLMDAWHVPVCALFKGRVVDRPEHPMPETLETSGGWVEHEVYMIEGIILIVIELKLRFKDLRDHTAQLLLGLVSAYKVNADKEFDKQPPVYAMLTDLHDFYILRYDGSTFSLYQDEITVPQRPRSAFLHGMINVTEILFSVILEGYIQTLEAVSTRSKSRGLSGDVSGHNSAASGVPQLSSSSNSRRSLDKWTKALSMAKNAQHILSQVDCTSLDKWESSAAEGLASLQSSVQLLSKIGSVTEWSQEELRDEIEKVLLGRVNDIH